MKKSFIILLSTLLPMMSFADEQRTDEVVVMVNDPVAAGYISEVFATTKNTELRRALSGCTENLNCSIQVKSKDTSVFPIPNTNRKKSIIKGGEDSIAHLLYKELTENYSDHEIKKEYSPVSGMYGSEYESKIFYFQKTENVSSGCKKTEITDQDGNQTLEYACFFPNSSN